MLRRKRSAVEVVCQQRVRRGRGLNGKAALEGLFDAILQPTISPREHELDRLRLQSRGGGHIGEAHAGPLAGADRLPQPRLARRPRMKQGADRSPRTPS